MASWEDFTGWGRLMQPATPQQQQPGVLSDPAMQAAMLSFGLQAMSGGWGNGIQQAAQALGAGAQGAGAYTQQARQRELEEQAIADREAERGERRRSGEAQRQTQLEVARIGANSRQEIAALRAGAALDRVNDRTLIAQMQARQRAEAAAGANYTRQLTAIAQDVTMMGNASARAAAEARIRQEYDTTMARIQQLYPVAADGGGQPGGLSTVNPAVPPTAAPPAAAPSARPSTGAAPAAVPPPGAAAPAPPNQRYVDVNTPPGPQTLRGPRPAGPPPVTAQAVQQLTALYARAQGGDAAAQRMLQQILNNPQLGPQARSVLGIGAQ